MDWVIDTDVLVRADNLVNGHNHWFNVIGILRDMYIRGHSLSIDHEGVIDSQYRRNLGPRGLVYKFLGMLASRGQIRYLSGQLPRGIDVGLRALGFDIDDDVFVAVTSRTSSGLLVAEESDYCQPVVDFLLEHRIRVVDCVFASREVNIRSP